MLRFYLALLGVALAAVYRLTRNTPSYR